MVFELELELDRPVAILSTHHNVGTTRISENVKEAVVDVNCKVHSILNLFVAGGSVFTTGGYANPTLTIVALAIRLADHLKDSFNRQRATSGYKSSNQHKVIKGHAGETICFFMLD